MSLEPYEVVLEGATKAGLPHGLPDEIAKEYGYEPDDPYIYLTAEEMKKKYSKTANLKKAQSLKLTVYKSWDELKICKAIYKHFNK